MWKWFPCPWIAGAKAPLSQVHRFVFCYGTFCVATCTPELKVLFRRSGRAGNSFVLWKWRVKVEKRKVGDGVGVPMTHEECCPGFPGMSRRRNHRTFRTVEWKARRSPRSRAADRKPSRARAEARKLSGRSDCPKDRPRRRSILEASHHDAACSTN